MQRTPSTRAKVVTRRTYNRPTNMEGTRFETWEQTRWKSNEPPKMVMGKSLGQTIRYV